MAYNAIVCYSKVSRFQTCSHKPVNALPSLRGQRRQIDGFLKIRRPSQVDWDHYIFSDITKKSVRPNIDALLYRALQMRVIVIGLSGCNIMAEKFGL